MRWTGYDRSLLRAAGVLIALGALASMGLALAFTWFAGHGLTRLGLWMAR